MAISFVLWANSKTTFVTVNLDSAMVLGTHQWNSKTTFVTVNLTAPMEYHIFQFYSKTTFVTVNHDGGYNG